MVELAKSKWLFVSGTCVMQWLVCDKNAILLMQLGSLNACFLHFLIVPNRSKDVHLGFGIYLLCKTHYICYCSRSFPGVHNYSRSELCFGKKSISNASYVCLLLLCKTIPYVASIIFDAGNTPEMFCFIVDNKCASMTGVSKKI